MDIWSAYNAPVCDEFMALTLFCPVGGSAWEGGGGENYQCSIQLSSRKSRKSKGTSEWRMQEGVKRPGAHLCNVCLAHTQFAWFSHAPARGPPRPLLTTWPWVRKAAGLGDQGKGWATKGRLPNPIRGSPHPPLTTPNY